MKRINRVRKNKDFKTIISKHKVIKSNEFTVYFDKNTINHTRIGISTSSKIGNAFVRNRCRRQIRAMCNELLDLSKNLDIIIVVRDGFLTNTYQQNLKSLQAIIGKLQ